MNRLIFYIFLIVSLTLTSWGYKGHKAVALIAEKHLNPKTKLLVSRILNRDKIDNIASWADEVRYEPEYRQTATWHYLNVRLGLSFHSFEQTIKSQPQPNVYTAILSNEHILSDTTGLYTKQQQQEALKFLVHLVGDAHQPMHVSREEDKGGNTIKVSFNDKEMNLHSLWDSGLIDHENLSEAEMAMKYDKAPPTEIKNWQSSDPMEWLWESYQISALLYKEVENNNNIGESYYKDHIDIIHNRIEKAGIRLAGVLNNIADAQIKRDVYETRIVLTPQPSGNETPDSSMVLNEVSLDHIKDFVGKAVETQGVVFSTKALGGMTLVDLGGPYPYELLIVVLKGEAKDRFATEDLKGKTLKVIGEVIKYQGKPEIIVDNTNDVSVLAK